ncbi:MAG: Gfo/Idh/MocA family oxidoreductase [Thermoguttaceae bacterium]|jgi:predicted dehydrogenase|nr:Gfo/Idh/MocA family oxidoreductase [Thermoguttaceae bacterium]
MSIVTRRRFLRQSLAATAALSAAPYIARASAAKDKLGVAVVGLRGRGGSHLSAFSSDPRTQIVAVVEVDQEVGESRQEATAKRQGGFKPRLYRDMREAFADPNVDIVGTATPNHWHALCAVWAMQAGKDVYVEKPVSHNIAEGSAVVAAAAKYKRMCQVGTQCRSSQALLEAMEYIRQGGIGEVKFARGLCYKRRKSIGPKGDYPVPAGVDFNLWSGPAVFTNPKVTRPQFHYDWHWQRLYGNGDLGNQGPHQTDIARWGLGINSHPQSIISYGGRLGYQAERKDPSYVDAGDTANTEVSIYDYGDKCIVFETRGLDVDNSADEEINRLFGSPKGGKIGVIFYGSDGILVQRSYAHCIAYDKAGQVVKEFKGGENHFENFIDACVSRDAKQLRADAWEGHLSAGMSHLGNISYYLGEENTVSIQEAGRILAGVKSLDDNQATLARTAKHLTDNGVDLKKYPISMGPLLKFDPQREVFPDSPEATALLAREYRDGFVCPKADAV